MTSEDAATSTVALRAATTSEEDANRLSRSLTSLKTTSETVKNSEQVESTAKESSREHQTQQSLAKCQQENEQENTISNRVHEDETLQEEEGTWRKEPENEPKDDCILFIGDLARGLTEREVAQAFAAVGNVEMVDIKRDKVTMRNLGYGFVQMSSHEQAAVAKERMQGADIQGRRIRIGWAQRNTTLFIGDLDESTNVEDLHRTFGPFGLLYTNDSYLRQGKCGKYGSVKFMSRKDAETARREMHGRVLRDGTRPIRVVWHHPQTITKKTGLSVPLSSNEQHSRELVHIPPPPPAGVLVSSRPYSVHVHFEADGMENLVTENLIYGLFAPFGQIIAVILPQGPGILCSDQNEDVTCCRRGYGFVHFTGSALGRLCAIEAIRTLQGEIVAGIRLQCAFSRKPGGPVRASYGLTESRGTATMPLKRGHYSFPKTNMEHKLDISRLSYDLQAHAEERPQVIVLSNLTSCSGRSINVVKHADNHMVSGDVQQWNHAPKNSSDEYMPPFLSCQRNPSYQQQEIPQEAYSASFSCPPNFGGAYYDEIYSCNPGYTFQEQDSYINDQSYHCVPYNAQHSYIYNCEQYTSHPPHYNAHSEHGPDSNSWLSPITVPCSHAFHTNNRTAVAGNSQYHDMSGCNYGDHYIAGATLHQSSSTQRRGASLPSGNVAI